MGMDSYKYSWWSFPMKPVSIPIEALQNLDLSQYTMERKFDGWRAIPIVSNGIDIFNRHKRKIKISDELQEKLKLLNLPKGTVLDGEVWNPLKRGEWTNIDIWDMIRCGTRVLSNESIENRRTELQKLIPDSGVIKTVEVLEVSLDKIKEIAQEAQEARARDDMRSGFIHGVVLKKKGSIRHDKANRSAENACWLKVVFHGMKGYEPKI